MAARGPMPSPSITQGDYIPPIPRHDSNFAPSVGDYASSPTTPAIGASTPEASNPFLTPIENDAARPNKEEATETTPMTGEYLRQTSRRRPLWQYLAAAAVVVIVIVLAVILPVYFTVIKPNNNKNNDQGNASSSSSKGGSQSNPESPSGAITGGNGSIITTADNVTFAYINPFGGFCE